MPWTTLCELDEVKEDEGKYVDVDGRALAVFLHKGVPHVMDDLCPHAGGSLASGWVEEMGDTPCAVCPVHCWPFRLDTGEYYDMPGFEVRVYPTRVEEQDGRKLVQADLPMP